MEPQASMAPARRTRKGKTPTRPLPVAGDFVDAAIDYALAVVSGKIPAALPVRQACQRQLDDLGRQGTPGFPFIFDRDAANKPCTLLSYLPIVKGPLAGRRMEVYPFQAFAVTTVYGWRHKDTGFRRFRRAYLEYPRGSGKSGLLSGLAIHGIAADGQAGAECYSCATTATQARIVFDATQATLRSEDAQDLREALGLSVSQHKIEQPGSGSVFRPLSAEAGGHEGYSVSLALVDELHVHTTDAMLNVLKTGMAKRPESLMFIITTAGSTMEGPCYQLRDYVLRVLRGEIEDHSIFGIIYTLDPEDLPGVLDNEAAWIKANPAWGTLVEPTMIRQLALEAKHNPSARAAFLTRHCNVWVSAGSPFLDMARYADLGDAPPMEEFAGEVAWMGLDLASKSDLAVRATVFRKPREDGTQDYYCYTRNYLNEDAVLHAKNSPVYQRFQALGALDVTPGNVTDFGQIEADILEDAPKFVVDSIGFDPWQGQHMAQRLQEEGLPTLEVRPSVQNFSHAMKELQALIASGRWHHDGNEATAWMLSNVVAVEDRNGNVFPRKAGDNPDKKIDATVAILTALRSALASPTEMGQGVWVL